MSYKIFKTGHTYLQSEPYSAVELKKELENVKARYFLEEVVAPDQAIEVLGRIAALMESSSFLATQMVSCFDNAGLSKFDQSYLIRTLRAYLLPSNLRARWKRAFGVDGNISPAGFVAHIGASNTILGGLDGLIDGIISGNFNILKLPKPDGGLPGLLVEALFSVDTTNVLKGNIFAFWWKGGDKSIELTLKQYLDRVVIWGGQEAVLSWKRDLAMQTQAIIHGPKYGVGVITKDGLDSAKLPELAESLAWDISRWDQRACNSIQGLFVESKVPGDQLNQFLKILGNQLDAMANTMPPIRDNDDCVEILKAREVATAEEIINGSLVQFRGESWTINLWRRWSSGLIPSCLNRYLHIMPFVDLRHLARGLYEDRIWLQTLGYCASPDELSSMRACMGKIGISRICPFGRMSTPTGSDPHDGNYDLRLLTCVMSD